MSTISSLDGLSTTTTSSSTSSNALSTDDFLQIMITELTNQDPFEPMTNQDLIDQMAGIQQIQSSQNVTDTFTAISEKFDELMGELGSYVDREQLSSSTELIGQTIAGTTTDGRFAVGKVMAVNVDGSNVLLEIDTGELINLNDMQRLGGANSQDIIGTLVAGENDEGESIVGIVESLETDGQEVLLQLETGEEIPLSQATIITEDTAYLLLGMFVGGSEDTQGYVESYRVGSESGIAGITLVLDTGEELPLTAVTNIRITETEEE